MLVVEGSNLAEGCDSRAGRARARVFGDGRPRIEALSEIVNYQYVP